jgi:elongator complex protein 3
MPKSYIFDEPGCQRAERDGFDPYLQTLNRIHAFENIGHAAAKVELLILGGTWSAYSRDYRTWFVQRCFDAMNAAGNETHATSASLAEAQARNVTAAHRNVGLVIETRPDWITPDEIVHLRTLGVTKVQMGVQSLDDAILARNGRGHDVAAVRRAMGLLRTAGFKIHLHWMPNLDGATPESDRADFARFFDDPALRPDELKIYPCSLIAGTELYARWQAGVYTPYTQDELVALLADIKPSVPAYVRINRLFRDIPAHHIEAGVRAGNLREIVARELQQRGTHCGCIRCREIRGRPVEVDALALRVTTYDTDLTREHFVEFVTNVGPAEGIEGSAERARPQTAAFLRLSLPLAGAPPGSRDFLPELADSALIRELHVYGTALDFADDARASDPQHAGLGTRLLEVARTLAQEAGFVRISVIAATGTRGYYAARDFVAGPLYMTATLSA